MKQICIIALLLPALFATSSAVNADTVISRSAYQDRLRGFWLGSCIANWTGLQTEGQKVGKPYYTDADWGTNQGRENATIDYVLDTEGRDGIWGADDDTDIEYMYQHAMETYETSKLTGEQIRDQWLEHIDGSYIWVSNETAYYLMRDQGVIPPATSEPANNANWEMIDAQLTTEIFGLFAPANAAVALDIAELPIRTTAFSHSAYAAQFYVVMYSLASSVDPNLSYQEQTLWLADQARAYIPDDSYIAAMYDWVRARYLNTNDKDDWESVRDAFHDRYIAGGADGYTYLAFYDAGSNFGFSIISLLFGEGDYQKTVKIGTLSGQDSDNPTATWGGLLGFLYGHKGLEDHFNKDDFSDKYKISRTRTGFGGDAKSSFDTFDLGTGPVEEYIGYTFDGLRTFSQVMFQEGVHRRDGGWFADGTLRVQVRQDGSWQDVAAESSPAYPVGNELTAFGDGFERYTFTLENVVGDGIRLFGNAGGEKPYISVTELEVYADGRNIASEGEIVKAAKKKRNVELIRDGVAPMGTGIDTFSALAERGLSVVDRVVTERMGGTIDGDSWIIPDSQ